MAAEQSNNDPFGHDADTPGDMPRRAWRDIAGRTLKRAIADNVALVSAGVAFYGFFALLSLLALIVLSYSFITDPHALVEQMAKLTFVLPADVSVLIGEQLMTVVQSSASTKGTGLFIAVLVAIYGGTNGAAAVITALNIAYEEREKRSLLRFYILAISMTLAALIVALCALASAAAIAVLEKLFPEASSWSLMFGKIAGYVLLVLVAAAIASTLYRYGPSRENAKWVWITPGSFFAAIAWLILTVAFSFYLAHLTNYKVSYGPLAAVVALLSWMYFSAYAFVLGAELNSEIEHQTAKDSTTGAPQPLGLRGAWAADNVATDDEIQDRPEEKREGERLTEAQPTD